MNSVQVCKHFLDAVEKKQYGWFWTCPNGGKDCHYRHALPPGYVLKSQMKALLEEEGEKLSIEEEIENQVLYRALRMASSLHGVGILAHYLFLFKESWCNH